MMNEAAKLSLTSIVNRKKTCITVGIRTGIVIRIIVNTITSGTAVSPFYLCLLKLLPHDVFLGPSNITATLYFA